ncbi:MAG: DNA-3-methyladenine glycosylase [bacterium]|nr:DNA-3-methyladenine glycosylase [bacterium]MDZ4299880.1 DNA-3-methyladenine glycosylase [Candidatus Sungbacteria bacterium]
MKKIHKTNKSLKILKQDRYFARLIIKHGVPDMAVRKNPFQALVRSIIHQQLSGKAAETIYTRFLSLFGNKKKFPTPKEVSALPVELLRSSGLSAQKAGSLRDLAEKFSDGTIRHCAIKKMKNEEIIRHLTRVKGIGEWTAHMFLISTMNRPDILPTGDLGIRKGFQIVYGLKALPDKKRMEKLAVPWRAHASVASWYLWRAADEDREADAHARKK